jgi:hypothetical protein
VIRRLDSILERLAELYDQQNESSRARELQIRTVEECSRYNVHAIRAIAHELTAKVGDIKTSPDTD